MGLGPFARTFKRPYKHVYIHLAPLSASGDGSPLLPGGGGGPHGRRPAAAQPGHGRAPPRTAPRGRAWRTRWRPAPWSATGRNAGTGCTSRPRRGSASVLLGRYGDAPIRAWPWAGSSRRRPTSSSRRGVTPGPQKVSSERRPYGIGAGACVPVPAWRSLEAPCARHVRGDHVRARGGSSCRPGRASRWGSSPSTCEESVTTNPGRSSQEPAGPGRHGKRRDAWSRVTSLRRTCMHHQRRRAAVSAACRTCQRRAAACWSPYRIRTCMHAAVPVHACTS